MEDVELIGRDEESRSLRGLIDRLPDVGGSMVILGEPGIGKTSLVRSALGYARSIGLATLETTGVEAEARLPFAGLHQLLRPLLPEIDALPAPQRRALLSAFGTEDGPPPEAFMVALAALNLLGESAAARPAVIAVDDVQWLDQPTQEALAFIARRINRDPIVMVATLRKGHAVPFADLGLPELDLRGLNEESSRHVLALRASDLGTADRERILREALGNPLALVELPTALRMAQAPGAESVAAFLPLTARLENAFAGRVAELPGPTRDTILVAAVDYGDELPEILAAASVLAESRLTIDVLDAAVAARLVRVDGIHLHFHHPLVRSAVLQSETLTRRLAANAAMAEVLTDEPYRRTWHLAQSIIGPDDAIADELEAGHAISLKRGGVISAIWMLERAARLTTDSAQRGRRLLLAAEHAFGLGQADLVERLLKAASHTDLSDLDRARMEWLREIFNDGVPGDAERVFQLCDTARRSAAAGDTDLALNLLLGAALRCWWADTGPEARAEVVAVVEGLAGEGPAGVEKDPRFGATLAVAEPVLRGRAVTDWLAQSASAALSDGDSLRLLGMAAHAIGDAPRSVDLLGRAAQVLREQGRLGLLSHVIVMAIIPRLLLGDWEQVAAALEEGQRVSGETGQAIWTTGTMSQQAILSGFRGETERALELADAAEAAADRQRLNDLLSCVQLARGVAWLNAGQHGQAYEAFRRMFDREDPSYHQRESFNGVMFFAEAALYSGNVDEARKVIAELEEVSAITPVPLLHVHLDYARAVLADDADAEALFHKALGRDLTRWPLARAKLDLAFGIWLRRHRRIAEARTRLRSAQTILDLVGATGWADQARSELRAAGERTTMVAASPVDALSPQELQIARLAAEGLSNREIGERLYLSPRTIGSHLYRIFPKLNITSRAQLASRLDMGGDAVAPESSEGQGGV